MPNPTTLTLAKLAERVIVTTAGSVVAARGALAARRGQEVRDGFGDEGLDGGEGGAGEGDVDFDARPDAGVDAVEGGVGGDGDFVEGFEADDGGDTDAGIVSRLHF